MYRPIDMREALAPSQTPTATTSVGAAAARSREGSEAVFTVAPDE